MRTPPQGLTDSAVQSILREAWNLQVGGVEHLPWGFGAWHWEASDAAGVRRWFVTADRLEENGRRGDLDAAYCTALALSEMLPVLAPCPTVKGEMCCRSGDFALSVTPWVEGRRFEHGVIDDERARITADFLRELHRSSPPSTTRPWDPVYRSHCVLEDLDRLVREPWRAGPLGESARVLVRDHLGAIRAWTRRYRELAARAVEHRETWVVTHGEPGPHNQVHTPEGRVWWVDWESVRVAPRERDLAPLVASGVETWRAVYEHPIDRSNLELFDLAWRLDEIGQYAQWLHGEHDGGDDDRIALSGLQEELTRPGLHAA